MISEKGLELLDALEESLREDDAWHSEGGYFEAKDELLNYITSLERHAELREGIDPKERLPEPDETVLILIKNSWVGNRWNEMVFCEDTEPYFINNVYRWWHLPEVGE